MMRKEIFGMYELRFIDDARKVKTKNNMLKHGLVINAEYNFKLNKLFQQWNKGEKPIRGEPNFGCQLNDDTRFQWLLKCDVRFKAIMDGK